MQSETAYILFYQQREANSPLATPAVRVRPKDRTTLSTKKPKPKAKAKKGGMMADSDSDTEADARLGPRPDMHGVSF